MTEEITLYELCERSADSIELAPGHYNQGAWACRASGISSLNSDREICGTAFCRAGWMQAHISPPMQTAEWMKLNIDNVIGIRMSRLLIGAGCDENDVAKLFGGDALFKEQSKERGIAIESLTLPTKGTTEYAAMGAKGFRDFMARNEDKLRAATVQVYISTPQEKCNADALNTNRS